MSVPIGKVLKKLGGGLEFLQKNDKDRPRVFAAPLKRAGLVILASPRQQGNSCQKAVFTCMARTTTNSSTLVRTATLHQLLQSLAAET